jgi:hypothetical protein
MKRCLHILLLSLLSNPLLARPTEGGLFAFTASDEVVHYDTPEDNIRVHYSVSGPNVTVLTDNDQDGIPDFVQNVGDIAELSFATFHEELDFLMPLTDTLLNTDDGGSPAFDFYLVDFNGNGDGHFGLDGCLQDSPACIGYMVVENDFSGYGYASLYTALEVVVSHEIFHAVQAAYRGDFPSWVSEGTAVWAEKRFDENSTDFLALANNYLEDPSRSLHNPPTGPVPAFAYGTALFWDFLTTRHAPDLLNTVFTKTITFSEVSDEDWLALIDETLKDGDDTLADAFLEFAQWNLATGERAGGMPAYDYAHELGPLQIEGFGDTIDDSIRLFPMATQYFRLNHSGGPLYVLVEENIEDLTIVVQPVSGGALDGPVLDAKGILTNIPSNSLVGFNEEEYFNSGGYFLALVRTHYEGQSNRIRFCAGTKENVETCQLEQEDETPKEPATEVVDDNEPVSPWGCNTSSNNNLLFWGVLLWFGQKKRRSKRPPLFI